MRSNICIIMLALLCLSTLGAQEDSEWYIGKPIVAIVFDGLQNIRNEELVGIVQPFIGESFNDDLFLDLQRRLYALEYFSEIVATAADATGAEAEVTLRFQVREHPVAEDIRFSGNNSLNSSELLDVVLLKTGDIVTAAKIAIDEEAIRGAYLQRGFIGAEVRGTATEGSSAQSHVVEFRIQEGVQIIIRQIEFSGNSFASDGTLRGVMESKTQSIINRGTFQELELQEDRRRIERYYKENGYIDTRVTEIIRESTRDPDSQQIFLTLTIFIEEGAQYTYGGMRFEGNTIFSDEELMQQLRVSPGGTLNVTRVEADIQRVADLYYGAGYIFNTIAPAEERDEENRSVSYVVSITEQNRAHIENIIIRGNTKTKDEIIYRELPFEVGEIFSATRVRQGILNLLNLQFFSNVVPETPQGSAGGLMDLIINVEEANTADVRFGLAFGGTDAIPITLQVRWQERNFLGQGQIIGVTGALSTTRQQASFSFVEPWLLGERWQIGINFGLERSVIPNIRQDILAPVFADYDSNAVPDPYTGAYVFNNDATYNDVAYRAGDYFPGTPRTRSVTSITW